MKEQNITVREKTYVVTELKYSDVTSMAGLPKDEAAKKMVITSTGISEEEYNELSAFEGLTITKEINKLNGFDEEENFQKPVQNE